MEEMERKQETKSRTSMDELGERAGFQEESRRIELT
jgi:hypothetical protein